VELAEQRLGALVGSGDGLPFARGGKTLREWVKILVYEADDWAQLIDESVNPALGDATRSGQVSRPRPGLLRPSLGPTLRGHPALRTTRFG